MAIRFDDLPSVQAPRFSQAFDDLPDSPAGPTLGEFGLGTALQLGRGIQRTTRDTLALGARAASVVPDAVLGTLGLPQPSQQMVRRIGEFFEPGIAGATELMPEAYQRDLANPIVGEDVDGGLTLGLPTVAQVVGTLAESLPAIPGLVAGGGGIAQGGGRLATALGYGAANSAAVGQGQYFDTLQDVRDEALATGVTPERAIAQAEQAADTAQLGVGALSFLTGGAGGVLSRVLGGQAGSLPAALARGFVADAPLEGIEEGGQSLISDYAAGRELDTTAALNNAALGAIAGGLPGSAIAGAEYVANRGAQPAAQTTPSFDDLPDAVVAPEDTSDLEAAIANILPPPIADIPSPPAAETPAPTPIPQPPVQMSPSIDPDARALAQFDRDIEAVPEAQRDAVRKALQKPLPRDRNTGLYRAEELDGTIQAAQESGQPSVYVESDLSNLGGLNARLGAEGANRYLRQFADTVRAELEPLGATVGIRKGGDELGFVVQGATQADVDAAMARARESFAAQTQEFADLPHPKGAAPGVGFHYGTSEIPPGAAIGDVLKLADNLVEQRKKGAPYEQREAAETLGDGPRATGEGVVGAAAPAEGIAGQVAPAAAQAQEVTQPATALAEQAQDDAVAAGGPLQSRAPSPAAQAIRQALGPAMRDVNVLDSAADLPADVASRVQVDDRTEGFFDPQTGQSFIFADERMTPDRAAWVAVHERVGHAGLRGSLMDANPDQAEAFQQFATVLSRARQNPAVDAITRAIRKEEGYSNVQAAEEAIAELAAAVRTGNYAEIEARYGVKVPPAQRRTVEGYIRRLVQELKAALNRLRGKENSYSDADVYALIEGAWRYAQRNSTRPRGAPAVESRASNGAITETPAFRRWFGASKVVDAAGKPLVVYHGTSRDFTSFDPGSQGDAWANDEGAFPRDGFWFTSDPANADFYSAMAARSGGARQTVPVFLSIKKPFRITAEQWVEEGESGVPAQADLEAQGYDGMIIERAELDESPNPSADAMWEANRARYGAPYEWPADQQAEYRKLLQRAPVIQHTHYVAFRPEQIKSATGNSGAFDPANPSILESRRTRQDAEVDAERSRNTAAGTLPVSRGTSPWTYDPSAFEAGDGPKRFLRKGMRNKVRQVMSDKMIAWKDVQGQIAGQMGRDIPDAQNVYQLENLMHGRVSEGIARIERVQIEPLVEAMQRAKVDTATLEEYLYARHAKERNADIAAKNPAMPDGGSGMTNAEADAILAKADKAKLDPLAARVDAITRGNRKRLLDAGLITQESFDAMAEQYKHYVPLRGKRLAETDFQGGAGTAGRGIDTRRSPVQEALGRGAGNRAENILGEIIGDAHRGVILAEKARVGRGVMRLILANPNPKLWTVEPVQTERKTDANGEVYEAVVQDWSDPTIVAVKLGGKTYKVQINNAPLASALNNVGVDNLSAATRAAGVLNRYFSAVLTRYNPAFVPVNATRDALFGLTGLAVEHGELAALDAALHYPQAAVASFRNAMGKTGSGEWDTWAREFAEAGGKTGYVSMPSVEDLQRKIGKGKILGYSPTGVSGGIRSALDAIDWTNDAVENALRLSAYVTLRKKGVSKEQAATYAKNLTVNFNRKGSAGSALNSWLLFYNAALQGAKRTTELLKRPKTYAYLGALAGIQVAATMAAMGMEDDEGESLWNKIPDHVKRRNIVIPVNKDHILTIPMPYGFNVFTYMAGRVTGSVMDTQEKPTNRAGALAADMMSAVSESFFPVPIGDGALGFVPTVARIPINIQTNRNDFGRQIRTENPYGAYDVPRASMGRPDTLELFKVAANGLNRLGGGDEYTPPPMAWFDVAPEDIEYLLGEVTGGTGKFILDVATVGSKFAGEEPARASDVPIGKRYFTNINDQAAQQAAYYDRSDTLNRSLERMRDAFERQGEAAAQKMIADSPELSGVRFKRRKTTTENGAAGSIIVNNGRPQIEPVPGSLYAAYKDAEDAVKDRNEAIREAYGKTPSDLRSIVWPTTEVIARDRSIREQNKLREDAQRKFNAKWIEAVVSRAE